MFKFVHACLSDALSGAGYQGLQSLIQLGVAVFNVLINLWIIRIGVAVVALSRRSQTAAGDEAKGFVKAEA